MCSLIIEEAKETIHVLQDCSIVTQTRIRLLPSNLITNCFFNFMKWIFRSILFDAHNKKWTSIFMVACLHMQMLRSKFIFEVHFHCSKDPTYTILKMAGDIDNYTHRPLNFRQSDTIFIDWKRPSEGWVKNLTLTEPTRILWVQQVATIS